MNGYDDGDEVELRGFAGSMAAYAAFAAGSLAAVRASGRELPERYAARDVLIGGVATHKLSRLLARGAVASPLRAPVTEFRRPAGAAEHVETPRGTSGLRHAVGELVTCPFCLGVWVGTAYVTGLAIAPRVSRAWAATFTVVAVSDSLQFVYQRLREHGT